MNLPLLLKGLAVGVSIAAPVGPIGVLCIRRSLGGGMLAGLATGFGAATADATYGCVAGFGFTAVSSFLFGHRHVIGVIGGAFLCFLGVWTLFAPTSPLSGQGHDRTGLLRAWGSTFLLTLGNPATILSYVAVFAAFGLGAKPGYGAACWLVAGVFLGSAAWWLFLSALVSRLRSRVGTSGLRRINRVSGAVLLGFGIFAMLRP
jgi:threonine/homoserine/homoserine lactone efflux protein